MKRIETDFGIVECIDVVTDEEVHRWAEKIFTAGADPFRYPDGIVVTRPAPIKTWKDVLSQMGELSYWLQGKPEEEQKEAVAKELGL